MPYILNTDYEVSQMLGVTGAHSFEELFEQIPASLHLKEPLPLAGGLSEAETVREIETLARRNVPVSRCNSFLGAGCYEHYVPSALSFLLSRSEFVTAYTPYQPECSQGILQALYEYQSYICLLTGLEVSNASLLDGASALAEAVLMALRINRRKEVVLASSVHPEYKKTLSTYLSGSEVSIKEIPFNEEGRIAQEALTEALDKESSCFVCQSPNVFGVIEEGENIAQIVHGHSALLVLVTYPFSLALLKEPGAWGADIVCGDGQSLGGLLSWGGPSFGFLATKQAYLRQMPGRIIGKTTDSEGKPSYCLTIQAREQHIRRQRATSNICSNQSLNALGASIYLSLMGGEFKTLASGALNAAHYLYEELRKLGKVQFPFSPCFFNEFVWRIKDAKTIIKKLADKQILAGYSLGKWFPALEDCILSCCTEKKTKADIEEFVEALGAFL